MTATCRRIPGSKDPGAKDPDNGSDPSKSDKGDKSDSNDKSDKSDNDKGKTKLAQTSDDLLPSMALTGMMALDGLGRVLLGMASRQPLCARQARTLAHIDDHGGPSTP